MINFKVKIKEGVITPIHEIQKDIKPQIVDKPKVNKPIRIQTYYKTFHQKWETNRTVATAELKALTINRDKQYQIVVGDKDLYSKYNIYLNDYPEFELREFGNGKLFRDVRKVFANDNIDTDAQLALLPLMKYVETVNTIHKTENYIKQCDKYINIKYKQFIEILKIYYNHVHKAMIVDGYGYVITGEVGCLVINRVYRGNNNRSKVLDYAKTKAKKAEILARGGRIYNKEEEQWCKEHGIKYTYEDHRVYRNPEYFYEFDLLNCHLPQAKLVKFTISDFRESKIRGKTNKQLAEECNGDLDAICELGIDVKTKLSICLDEDKLLYSNFIRNENQSSVHTTKVSGKDR